MPSFPAVRSREHISFPTGTPYRLRSSAVKSATPSGGQRACSHFRPRCCRASSPARSRSTTPRSAASSAGGRLIRGKRGSRRRPPGIAPARMAAMPRVPGFVSFVLTFAALQLLVSKFGRFALDRPNERSLHERPVPRTGGLALLVGAFAALAFGAGELWLPLGLALALAIVSFVDDLRGLRTALRLVVH